MMSNKFSKLVTMFSLTLILILFQNCQEFESTNSKEVASVVPNDVIPVIPKGEDASAIAEFNPIIESVYLVISETEKIKLDNNQEIDISMLSSTNVNLEVVTNNDITSVDISVNGTTNTESGKPYESTSFNLLPGSVYNITAMGHHDLDGAQLSSNLFEVRFQTKESSSSDLLANFSFIGKMANSISQFNGTISGRYLSEVNLKLDGKAYHKEISDQYIINIDTKELSNGEHILAGEFKFTNGSEEKLITKELKFIVDNEPIVIGTNPNAYYVATNGNDANDGKNPNSPLKTIQVGVDKLAAGDTLYVKAGNYGDQKFIVKQSGLKEKIISIEGYRNTPGDNPTIKGFNHTSALNSDIMPLIDSGTRETQTNAIDIRGKYITIKNFQVTRYRRGLYIYKTSNVIAENIITKSIGDTNKHYNGHGLAIVSSTNSILRNSVSVNSTAQAISIEGGSNNTVEACRAYANDNSKLINSNTDYYFIVYASSKNIIRNNYIERVGDLKHGGHGYTVKKSGSDNIFENNKAVGIANGGFVARHRGVKNNIWRNNICTGCKVGILARDGATNNLFENITINGSGYGIMFSDTDEDDGMQAASINNTFKNITIDKTAYVLRFSHLSFTDSKSTGNVIDGLKVGKASYLIYGGHYSTNNLIKNSDLNNIANEFKLGGKRSLEESKAKYENVKCTGCGFQTN